MILIAIILCAIGTRIWAFYSIDGYLPAEGLYVDEVTYSMSPFTTGVKGFSRPPGMFIFTELLHLLDSIIYSRIIISLISLLPALALYLAFGKKSGIWVYICTAGLIISPFMILFGFQLLPAVPAAALIAFSLLALKNDKTAVAGLLTGIAILFRGELVLVPFILLAFSFRYHLRKWLIFTGFAAIAVSPVIIFNLFTGAGPVIASNGGENLWIGTEWELITTPPGTEFEELVSAGSSRSGGDTVFMERAFTSVIRSPLEWISMGGSKLLGFFTLPGPGRNLETGWLLQKTWLILLLPLTLLGMSTGISAMFRRDRSFWHCAAAAFICSGMASAFIFFPSARFRSVILPAFWFLSASLLPQWKTIRKAIFPVFTILIISLFITTTGWRDPG